MKQLSQKEFEKCPKWLKKPKTFHSKLETLRYETIPITFHLNFVGEKLFIILSVSVLSVSVSADMKIIISVFYRYRPIWKKAYRSYTDEYTYTYYGQFFLRSGVRTWVQAISLPKTKLLNGRPARSCPESDLRKNWLYRIDANTTALLIRAAFGIFWLKSPLFGANTWL